MNLRNHESAPAPDVSFSALLKNGVVEFAGQSCGKVDDVIVALRPEDFAQVVVLVVKDGAERTCVLADDIDDIRDNIVYLKTEPRGFRPSVLDRGEVSLRADILCQRVVDITRSALVKVYDVRLSRHGNTWAAVALDVHRGRWFGFGSHAGHSARDWRSFLPLSSATGQPVGQSSPNWIGRLKAHQIADLIEDATPQEQDKLLEQVHSDPELEADVFEEMEENSQAQVFKSLADEEVADVLSHMRADDAADAVMELAQDRREAVLALLPEVERKKVMTLLGYNEATAGGLMGTEFIALHEDTSVGEALQHIRDATTNQAEALVTIHSIGAEGKLTGVLGLVRALQSDAESLIGNVADHDFVAASPDDDISAVITRMADFNLLTLPVVSESGVLLGVVTVDDALEASLPAHWLKR